MRRVWYAAYGSNCWEARLGVYLKGGYLPEVGRSSAGSSDSSPPSDSMPFVFLRRLRFAGHARSWGGTAPAHLSDEAGLTLGRAWLVSWRQFEDIFAQENGNEYQPLRLPERSGTTVVEESPYGRVANLGWFANSPIVGFDCPPTLQLSTGEPSDEYLTAILRGLVQTYRLAPEQLARHLGQAKGLGLSFGRLIGLARSIVEEELGTS